MKKITTYVLTISEFFPKTHNKAVLPTGFIDRISNKTKIHTIRGNYKLWKKRFKKINNGEAVLVLKIWIGKPYGKGSTNKEVFRFTKEDGIGLQKLIFSEKLMTSYECIQKKDERIFVPIISTISTLAKNDGLTTEDFKQWFQNYNLDEPMAIIHFTNFRY